ncbi:DUF2199 domain-containing protein [Streptomyces chrestomyceticus]|uniref:DUF2199 domain-containing protein n=1 Tax=Streptomyces chrestomyceticus TaxID=68185 RepID=UPI0036900376
MTSALGFTCSCCGQFHAELPMHYAATAPYYWDPSFADADGSLLSADQCVIKAEHYFVKGLVEIPVIGSDDVFSWAVWTSLSRDNFARSADLRDAPKREAEGPYFGWLATELSPYSPSTVNLKTHVHTRPVGQRPFIELEPTDHPLAVEQRNGITLDRVRDIAEAVLHPTGEGA